MIKEFAHKSNSCSKDLIGKDTLLHEAKLMCSIADGLIRFVNIKHPELLKNKRKKYSLFFLKNALFRMDSCIVLLENGSSLLKCKDGSTYIDPFSILILVRSIYESLVVHYYICAPQEDCVADILIRLWKMSGMKNRHTKEMNNIIPKDLKDKFLRENQEIKESKTYVTSSEIYKNTSKEGRALLDKAMNELISLKIRKESDEYIVEQISFSKAYMDIFSDTTLRQKASIIYKHLSAISHPSYLNYIQSRKHDGAYNSYVEIGFEGGIIYLRKLIADVVKVIPESEQYISSLSTDKKDWLKAWEIK